MDKREIKQYWLCNACNEVYETVNNNGFEYEIEDIEVECPHCHGYMDICEIDKEYHDKMQEMSKKINDLKKRDKRHQREHQRETQNRQSKEFKLFDKETKNYSYSVIFTNDLKEIFDAKNDCKALFKKDQDNDYFYVFDKNGKYVKCISQENGFCGTWNEFKKYSMIQWSNSECVMIYLKDYSETTIESILEAYLLENESLCLENDLMESNMEIKCLNTETNDIITITFTGDIEVMTKLQKQCKNDIENDIDNFSEFKCYDYNQVFALDRVLDKHNKFKGSFRHYKEIEYITDFERVVYLENLTQENIDSWINIFLSEYEIFELVESNMDKKQTVTIEVREYSNVYHSEILKKETILEKIENLDKQEIFEYMCLEIDKDVQTITCFMDLRDGSIFYSYKRENEYFQLQEGMNYLKLSSLNYHFQTPFKNESHRFKNPTNFYNKSSWIDWDAYMKYAFDMNEIEHMLYFVYDFDRENRD